MPGVMLLVGTRKGAFLLEGDSDRRQWKVRGPLCEGWPVYHAVYDGTSGSIYAAAASEWHGSAIWRSHDLGETWTLSSEGLAYDNDQEAVEGLEPLAGDGRLLVGVEAPGIFESRDDGDTWSLLRRSRASRAARSGTTPRTSRRAISASRRSSADRRRPRTLLGDRAGHRPLRDGRRRRDMDAAQPRPARRLAARARGGRLLRAQGRALADDGKRMYQQNHVGMHRSDDRGQTWTEITEGLPTEFGFAAAAHPHDQDTFFVIPLDPGHGRDDAGRRGRGLAHEGRRLELAAADERPAAAERASRRSPRGDGARHVRHAGSTTSAPAPARCSRARTTARPGTRSRVTCRRSRRSRSPTRLMADVHLPMTLTPLFAGLPRRLDARRADGRRRDRQLEPLARAARPSLRAGPAIRQHIHVYVDRERAGSKRP